MTGSACQKGASAKADAFLLSKTKIILLNVLSWETAFCAKIDISHRHFARLFVSIAHAHAQKGCARTRT